MLEDKARYMTENQSLEKKLVNFCSDIEQKTADIAQLKQAMQ